MMDELTQQLLAARDGDRLALSTFLRRTQPDVWRLCAHLVDPQTADDLTQDIYVRAMRSVERFRGDAAARTWLLSIARRTCADELRRRQRRRRYEQLDRPTPQPSPSQIVDVALLLDDLDPDRREAFVLTQLVGLSYAEAADVCQVATGTIRSRVARARQHLADAISHVEASAT
jgi:RNA polymerase sigma-70 factor (ECF subfamily)